MNPEEIDYSECAPEIDEAHAAYIRHLEQEVLKLDGFCTCSSDNECPPCRAERLAKTPRKMPVPAPEWNPRYPSPRYAAIGNGLFVRVGNGRRK